MIYVANLNAIDKKNIVLTLIYYIPFFFFLLFLFFLILRKEFVLSDSTDGVLDTWEDPHMVCPDQCVCQRSPFMDLSVARWIQGIRRENYEDVKEDTDAYQNVLFNEVLHCKFD